MKIYLVGGFLGSGKTTAIYQAALYLQQQKKKVGVITNDQGSQQVDTGYIRSLQIPAEEVAGSCFCCNYDGLDNCIRRLTEAEQPEIIFAESVGSCTDLAATIMNPLMQFHEGEYDTVLSVFADVRLLLIYLQKGKDLFHGNVNYIFGKQLEEADIIVVNKIDLLGDNQLLVVKELIESEYQGRIILYQNSLSEKSIAAWMNALSEIQPASFLHKTIGLDYDRYGAGEAELAWFDGELEIETSDQTAGLAAIKLIKRIYRGLIHHRYPIAHLKFLVDDGVEVRKISFTAMDKPQDLYEPVAAAIDHVLVLINARVQTEPALVDEIIFASVSELESTGDANILLRDIASFKPGYPKPTHRLLR